MKKLLATLLALIMCLGTLSGFAAAKEFKDVKPTDWFYNDVKSAVELGLVNGKGDTTYAPNDNLTYAEAIKLAACMHQLYTTGIITLEAGDPWYETYAEYCKTKGIITKDYSYAENATRAGYMEIFAKALPGDGLKEINSVADNSIPDVASSKSYAAGVYKLYRAGILQGVDAAHNCNPFNNITRAEVAAILTRMMNSEKRVKFTLGEVTKTEEKEEPKAEEKEEVKEEVKEEPKAEEKEEVKTEPKEEPKAEEKEEVVVSPITFTQNPIGGTIEVGATIATSVIVKGGVEPYTYKWEYNDGSGWNVITSDLGKVSGQDTQRISVKAAAASSYKVRCIVNDANGTAAISEETEFTFTAGLHITRQPEQVTGIAGKPLVVSVKVAGGTPPYTYQWAMDANGTWYSLVNAYGIVGGDTDTMIYTPSKATSAKVRCIIKDASGKQVETDIVEMIATDAPKAEEKEEEKVEEVKPDPFELVKAPKSTTVGVGEDAVCTVEVKGGVAPYTYQWYYEKDGAWNKFPDATSEKLAFTTNSASVFTVRCVIIDGKKTKITTPSATMTIEDKNALELVTQPAPVTVKVGEDAKLFVETKGGSDKVTYQWQMDISGKGGWVKLSDQEMMIGTQTPELTLKSKAAATLDIRCVITDTATNTRIESKGVKVTFE